MEPEKKSNGALVGLTIIVVILVIGGLYIWQSKKEVVTPPADQSSTVSDQDSNDLNTLQQNVDSTDTNVGVDASTVN